MSQHPTGCPRSPWRCHPSLTAAGARPWHSSSAVSWHSRREEGAWGEGGTDPGRSRYCRAWPAARGPRRPSLRAARPRSAASWSWPLARRSPSTGSTGTTPPTRRELQHSTAASSSLLLLLAPRGPGVADPSCPARGSTGHGPRHRLRRHHPKSLSWQRCRCRSLPCSSLPFGVPALAAHVPPKPHMGHPNPCQHNPCQHNPPLTSTGAQRSQERIRDHPKGCSDFLGAPGQGCTPWYGGEWTLHVLEVQSP